MSISGQKEGAVLGLDIGANSVGWALLKGHYDHQRLKPDSTIASGVRIFEAGIEGNLEQGRDEAKGVSRRQARLARRLLDRRARRMAHLYNALASLGLLPELDRPPQQPKSPQEKKAAREALAKQRHQTITKLDQRLLEAWKSKLLDQGAGSEELDLLPRRLPYVLRAAALNHRLNPEELGRALFHLGHRRGFLSNRKAAAKDEDEKGIKKDITELQKAIDAAGCRTLGEYFSTINPDLERIRARWTGRPMYETEFEAIWESQRPHYPDLLTDDAKKRVHKAIFYQRPLKIRKEFVGACQYEKDRKRAPMALLTSQRFRLLQQINNLSMIDLDTGEWLKLAPDQREKLIGHLDLFGDLTFAKAKKLLGLPRTVKFNLEEGGEKRLVGNRTAAKIVEVLGPEAWQALDSTQREQIVDDLRSFEKEEALAKRARKVWKLDEEKAQEFARITPEDGYLGLSRQALKKLLPLMEQGLTTPEAAKQVYGDQPVPEAVDLLPPVIDALPDLRNPAVSRALTELRKVVNALVREHGKPDEVRIELARDLKKNRLARQRTWKKNRANQTKREKAAKEVIKETGNANPSRRDVEKWLLAEECGWRCPFTGKAISMTSLFGPSPQFDVEHIVPFSRSLDNSYLNKTLCDVAENRNVKGNRTPWEAYGSTKNKWEEMVARVRRFKGDAAREKLRRFHLKEIDLDDFASQQLNDTKYTSKLAKQYIGLLYGNKAASAVQATKGGVTAFLRNVWDLNKVLGDGGSKSRDDHRHHAVDAIVVALTDRSKIKALSDSAVDAAKTGKRLLSAMVHPWPGFWEDANESIQEIVVSHRVNKRIKGRLHKESFYSTPQNHEGKPTRHIRRSIGGKQNCLKKSEVKEIVDPVVREAVVKALGGGDPEKVFQDEANHPYLVTKSGDCIPIHKVRIRKAVKVFRIGQGDRQRNVETDTNHHLEIRETKDAKGQKVWKGEIVSLFEALQRVKGGRPLFDRDKDPDAGFVFSLAKKEAVSLENAEGKEGVFIVRSVSRESSGKINIELVSHTDARLKNDIKKDLGAWVKKTPNSLRSTNPRKVTIDPIGRIRRAND